MALKGTTKIELTNVKTGEKEVIEKDNLVTNAVADVLQMNPFGFMGDGTSVMDGGVFAKNIFPICPNLFGGILLYENALAEDPDEYYAPYSNPIVGYSSNDVNSKADIKRGSMNQTESGALEDGSGYRFVFDFETSQANGTISAVGLTSKWGGRGGYKSAEQYYDSLQYLGTWSEAHDQADKTLLCTARKVDFEQGIIYSAWLSSDNTITVGKLRLNFHTTPLVGKRVSSQVLERSTIATQTFGKYSYRTFIAFLDGGDGHIWGFQHANNTRGNSSGNATVNWIKINPEDWSFEEGTWTLPLQLACFGYADQSNSAGAEYSVGTAVSIIHDGFLYCLNYNENAVYKIQLNNITNIKTFEFEDKSPVASVFPGTSYNNNFFQKVGNALVTLYGFIVADEFVYAPGPNNISNSAWANRGENCFREGPFNLSFAMYTNASHNAQVVLALVAPYLATINNLPNPVQKTADKTMKITYILREES